MAAVRCKLKVEQYNNEMAARCDADSAAYREAYEQFQRDHDDWEHARGAYKVFEHREYNPRDLWSTDCRTRSGLCVGALYANEDMRKHCQSRAEHHKDDFVVGHGRRDCAACRLQYQCVRPSHAIERSIQQWRNAEPTWPYTRPNCSTELTYDVVPPPIHCCQNTLNLGDNTTAYDNLQSCSIEIESNVHMANEPATSTSTSGGVTDTESEIHSDSPQRATNRISNRTQVFIAMAGSIVVGSGILLAILRQHHRIKSADVSQKKQKGNTP